MTYISKSDPFRRKCCSQSCLDVTTRWSFNLTNKYIQQLLVTSHVVIVSNTKNCTELGKLLYKGFWNRKPKKKKKRKKKKKMNVVEVIKYVVVLGFNLKNSMLHIFLKCVRVFVSIWICWSQRTSLNWTFTKCLKTNQALYHCILYRWRWFLKACHERWNMFLSFWERKRVQYSGFVKTFLHTVIERSLRAIISQFARS